MTFFVVVLIRTTTALIVLFSLIVTGSEGTEQTEERKQISLCLMNRPTNKQKKKNNTHTTFLVNKMSSGLEYCVSASTQCCVVMMFISELLTIQFSTFLKERQIGLLFKNLFIIRNWMEPYINYSNTIN